MTKTKTQNDPITILLNDYTHRVLPQMIVLYKKGYIPTDQFNYFEQDGTLMVNLIKGDIDPADIEAAEIAFNAAIQAEEAAAIELAERRAFYSEQNRIKEQQKKEIAKKIVAATKELEALKKQAI